MYNRVSVTQRAVGGSKGTKPSDGLVSTPLCEKEQKETDFQQPFVYVSHQTYRDRDHGGDLNARRPLVGLVSSTTKTY